MSFMTGKGLSTTQLLNLVVNTLYDKFVEKDIKEFDGFNVGILDTFNTINMALPGKHYVAPSYKDVKDLFKQWKEIDSEEKREKFIEFINEKVNLNKVDESMLITAIVAPPAAMMAKKTGQIVPQLALMNAIPDVVFVPSATLLALIAIKIIRLTFTGKTTSKNTMSSTTDIEKDPQIKTEQEPQTPTTLETELEEPQIENKQEFQTPTTPETEAEEPQIETEQAPQTPATPETETEEKPHIETRQEPPTTPGTEVEEPQIETEQTPQTPTTPETEQEPPTTTTSETEIEEEPQTTTTPETLKEKPQIGAKQEPPTTMTPEIEKEPQSRTTTMPETTIQRPQVAIEQERQIITGHVHKDNTTCFLCEELIARIKEGRID